MIGAPLGVEFHVITPVKEFPRLLAAVAPASWRAVLSFYASYLVAAGCFVVSLYLFLPVLREAGAASVSSFDYETGVFGSTIVFSLPWWLPFVLVVGSAWLLALSKRREFLIWRHAHREFWRCYEQAPGQDILRNIKPRRVEGAAKARAKAIRWLALIGLDLVTALALFVLLVALDPWVLPLFLFVFCSLLLCFGNAIWHSAPGSAQQDIESQIGHRLRLVNAQQVFFGLMPLTILLLLLFSRLGLAASFDLADLLFLSVLLSALGKTIASIWQTSLRLMRLDETLLECWHPLCRGDAAVVSELLQADTQDQDDEGDED